MQNLLGDLKNWRARKAAMEGVEPWRVLPNATLEEIARRRPGSAAELMAVKGIKEAKCRKYGAEILGLVRAVAANNSKDGSLLLDETRNEKQETQQNSEISADENSSHEVGSTLVSSIMFPVSEIFTVSKFLDALNLELSGMAARVRGEVSSVDERERVVYFTLKDAEDGSTLSCLIFRSAYAIAGIRLAVGDEVIAEGAPEIWKPMGKLSFKCGFVEYAGEGALKKAYDALLTKLTTEGLLAPERKRETPAFPTRIALLTSRDGAAIGDFMMNVGRHGYRIDFYASSVEGARAVPELLSGIQHFAKHADQYDVLVVIRGGGSLESLAAFNNETLVRAIAEFPVPVIAGIGHEKDITLASLAADVMVSTPTAAARAVRQSWEEGAERVGTASHRLVADITGILSGSKERLGDIDASLLEHFQSMKERIRTILDRFLSKREWMLASLRSGVESLAMLENSLKKGKNQLIAVVSERLAGLEKLLAQFDPIRALRLGYSLVRLSSGKLLRKSTDAAVGDRVDIRLADGGVGAEIIEIIK